MKIECYFDGATEPVNPGGAMGIGALVKIDGKKVWDFNKYYPPHPNNTNNIAEYIGVANVIHYLKENGYDDKEVTIMGDSMLVINQMSGKWGMKSGAYIPYAEKCLSKLSEFRVRPTFKWIGRDFNQEADDLSKAHLISNNIKITERKKP